MKAKTLLAIAVITFATVAAADDQGVAWDQLNEEQRRVLSSFSDSWDQLTPERQARLSMGADRWSAMTPKQ
ncbi:MAG: DUF3106 domain-containing protein, partial [Gammaproteobacteria bacterium]|nr:DUF3106 domain-containing protein [Gammaproteobacteria bacterium]